MIICNETTKQTATRSSLETRLCRLHGKNRGYERSEHPRMSDNRGACTLKECPFSMDGRPLQGRFRYHSMSGGATHAPVIERRRFQRLGGMITDNHYNKQ